MTPLVCTLFQPRKFQCLSSQFALHGLRALEEISRLGSWGWKNDLDISDISSKPWRNLPPHMGRPHGDPQTSPQHADPRGFLV